MMAIIYFCALIFIFLWAMGLLRKGLMTLTSSRIEKSLLLFTDHPVKAILGQYCVYRGSSKQFGVYGHRYRLCEYRHSHV